MAYRAYKSAQSGEDKLKLTQDNLITGDLRNDFAKGIKRGQRAGEKAVSAMRNGINATAYAGSSAATILPWVKGGAIVGGVAGTATAPVLGTTVGTTVGAVIGLVAGVMALVSTGFTGTTK